MGGKGVEDLTRHIGEFQVGTTIDSIFGIWRVLWGKLVSHSCGLAFGCEAVRPSNEHTYEGLKPKEVSGPDCTSGGGSESKAAATTSYMGMWCH